MSRVFLYKVLLVSFLLLSLFFAPSKSFAQAPNPCAPCEDSYNACRNICGDIPPQSIACSLGCNTARIICIRTCNPEERIAEFCRTHPTDTSCRRPSTGGEFCDEGRTQLRTAVGCITTEPGAFIRSLIRYSYAIGGGIALILMIVGAFQMITSAGNPESIKKGREQFIGAASGLVFLIISTLLLKIIGVDILAIPGF